MAKVTKSRISGKEATYVALVAAKYPPVKIGAPNNSEPSSEPTQTTPRLPAPVDSSGAADQRRTPPRVRKPSPLNNQCLAPTADLEGYRAQLREAFGNTMSDEFVDVMLGKLMEALKPNPFDQLGEATLNAALAIISSTRCQSELEALIAVEIVATGFAGLRFLRQSQNSMTTIVIEKQPDGKRELRQAVVRRWVDKIRARQIVAIEVRRDSTQSGHSTNSYATDNAQAQRLIR